MLEEVVIIMIWQRIHLRRQRPTGAATRLDNLTVDVIKALMKDNPKVTLDHIDEVGLGQVGQAGELLNMGSAQIAQLAYIPYESSKFESNRQCGSSMEVMQRIAQAIMLGTMRMWIMLRG